MWAAARVRLLRFALTDKASIKSVTVGGATATFRTVPETYGNLQTNTVTLPNSVASGRIAGLNINYSLPVESNTGLAAISPIGSQFLPLSFWYPAPNTPFTVRGADTAPFRLVVNGQSVISFRSREKQRGRIHCLRTAAVCAAVFCSG